ncbi:PAS domain-containing protein [Pedobacter deserti]|uniref:PAS domain-containing protein n=1 Tax=Pedobacter deserti TaxID=2817382 RepID=UPI00210DB425|nr:PAS domain-containing protein [Pedobacter sp. SYSU D00382]
MNNSNAENQLLRAALDASTCGIIVTDNQLPDNPIIYCNQAFVKLSGYQREEVIGRNCRFLQGSEREQASRAAIRAAVDSGEAVTVEIRNYRKNGQFFWNELYISPIRDESGNVTHFVGVQNDVTRRKNAEEDLIHERELVEGKVAERTAQLRESEEYLDSIVQTIRQGLLVLDSGYRVISANDFFLKTFKVEKRETEGKSLYELGNGQWNITRLKELLERILPTNNPVLDFEVEHDFPHIGRKLMLLNAHRVELEGTYKDRILLAIEDITEVRAAENRKDDFLSVSSHELKTPLTTIKGYHQALKKYLPLDTQPKIRTIVEKTGKQIARLDSIITSLLEMSRIQNGIFTVNKESLDLNLLVSEVADELRPNHPNHEIQVVGKVRRNVLGDDSQLAQVLTNLIVNAIKYSPDSKAVSVHLSEVSEYAKIAVTDYGIGISADDQKRVFDRFYRANDIQRKFPGMGIGLYICQQIVSHHGGTLWVDSEPGRGSTFSLTLPVESREVGND